MTTICSNLLCLHYLVNEFDLEFCQFKCDLRWWRRENDDDEDDDECKDMK